MKIVVSCDQGGAEVLSSYLINKIDNKKYRYFLKGPAIKVFQKILTMPTSQCLGQIFLQKKYF